MSSALKTIKNPVAPCEISEPRIRRTFVIASLVRYRRNWGLGIELEVSRNGRRVPEGFGL
jgi:hypothetical protein